MLPFNGRPLLATRLERMLARLNGLSSREVGVGSPDQAQATTLVIQPQAEVSVNGVADSRRGVDGSESQPSFPATEPLIGLDLESFDTSPKISQGNDPAKGVVERDGLFRRISRLLGWK